MPTGVSVIAFGWGPGAAPPCLGVRRGFVKMDSDVSGRLPLLTSSEKHWGEAGSYSANIAVR
jgi:hypothetical protein